MLGEDTRVQVCVRVRPLLTEALPYERPCVRVLDGTSVVVGNDRTYAFDRVFPPSADGTDVFSAVGQSLVEAFVDGYHTTIVAYGQTGAGKTYTMRDLTQRCIVHLGSLLDACQGDDPKLSLTVLEIYNEQVLDLLDPAHPRLHIREGADGDVFVAGQRVADVDNVADLDAFIDASTASRRTASTSLNATSSRSHCLTTITLTRRPREGRGRTTSRLTLVDLAGSERIKKAHTGDALAAGQTDRVREGIHINSGLLALGNVIHALCDKKAHVPFRASKLTRILQSSLAGNSRTVMIACVSSGDNSMDESLNTLKYADRARQLRTTVTRNHCSGGVVDAVEADRMVRMLQADVEQLKRCLCEHQVPLPSLQSAANAGPSAAYAAEPTRDMQRRLITLEEELIREKRFSRTLEEDLYRAEFSAMREVELRKAVELRLEDALRSNREGTDALTVPAMGGGDADNVSGVGTADGEHEVGDSIQHDIVEKERLIEVLVEERSCAQRTMEEYQMRLKAVLQDKLKLQRELEAAEHRLEETQMEQHKKDAHRANLKASYEAKVRAAEVSAAEYRRRVRDAEAAIKARVADEDQLTKLRRELATLKDSFQRQRDNSRAEQIKLGKLVVNQRNEMGSLCKKIKELEARHAQTARKAAPTPPAASTPPPRAATPRRRMRDDDVLNKNLRAEMESLEVLEKELADAEGERENIRNTLEMAQQSSDTARWRRAIRGFNLRLEQLEEAMAQSDGSVHVKYLEEKRSIQRKMMQLDELRPAYDEALEQLREIEERIDSIQVARNYRMKVIRSLQTHPPNGEAPTGCIGSSPWQQAHAPTIQPPMGRDAAALQEEAQHGLKDTIRAQQMIIEELNQRITDQALLLQQLLPVSKDASRAKLLLS